MSTIAVVTSVYLSYSVTAAFTNDIDQETRRLISSSSCASADYTLGCNATNPAGCPCTAFTDEERTQILDAHNERRELAASGNELCATSDGSSVESCPAATDMNALLWDESLEVIATCDYDHHSSSNGDEQNEQYEALCNEDGCLAVGYDGDYIGENIAAAASSWPNWDIDDLLSSVTAWYNESTDYYWDSQTSFDTTGHWTQGVWAKTRYIGCGYAACDTGSPWGESGSWSEWLFFVCKYFPGGNYGNGYPYTEGTKCSECEDDRSSCIDGLCDGRMCLNCAVDYFNDECDYDNSTCPSAMYYGNGIGGTSTTSTTPYPTQDPTQNPTADPTMVSIADPTSDPTTAYPTTTMNPTPVPTSDPTSPTSEPTITPTPEPTDATNMPTMDPTDDPTVVPTAAPTSEPTTMYPTTEPTAIPTSQPTDSTNMPTHIPTHYPTMVPSSDPTYFPTMDPTMEPTVPTTDPTANPTISVNPTADPTVEPTRRTFFPTPSPTASPSMSPTISVNPTTDPTMEPSAQGGSTRDPTTNPTMKPTVMPTMDPVRNPRGGPSMNGTRFPTENPTVYPTEFSETNIPTMVPTTMPSKNTTGDVIVIMTEMNTETTDYDINLSAASGNRMDVLVGVLVAVMIGSALLDGGD